MDFVKTAFNDLCELESRKSGRKNDKRKHVDEETDEDENGRFKSKNLEAERRRRKKLNDRQLELRSLVPIITNMNKASIVTDAITYIEELKNTVEELTNQLHQMEATSNVDDDHQEKIKFEEIDKGKETMESGLTPQVEISRIYGAKLWIKIVFEKKNGRLIINLMEAMNVLGFELTDTCITTFRGSVLFTSSAEGIQGGLLDVDQIKEFLLEIIKSF